MPAHLRPSNPWDPPPAPSSIFDPPPKPVTKSSPLSTLIITSLTYSITPVNCHFLDMVFSVLSISSKFLLWLPLMDDVKLNSGMSHSYSTQRDMNLAKHTGYTANSRRFDERNTESPATVANQLSEQISSLNDRMDEFTNCIEELNSKLTIKKSSSSQQNMSIQADACNGFAPTSYFISTLSNGSLTGSVMPNSSSSSQLAKESPLMEEISGIARGQRQILHQLDNLNNIFRESLRERSRQVKANRKSIVADVEPIAVPIMLSLAIGGLGVFLIKGFITRN